MIDYDLAESINTRINEETVYQSDFDRVGKLEFWDVADRIGDCEDYALAKRAALLECGESLDDIRMAVCRSENGGGHAVLVVTTDKGEYVLDNRYALPVERQMLPYTNWAIQKGDKWCEVL